MLSQIQVELRDPKLCDEVLKRVNEAAHNVASQFQMEGNAWDLAADASGVEFTYSLMDGEPGGKVRLETYRRALEAWREFLADESCDERILDLPD